MRGNVALALCAVAVVCGGCRKPVSTPAEAPKPEEEKIVAETPSTAELQPPTAEQIAAVKVARRIEVALETDKGKIALELEGTAAPVAVANFVNLVRGGFYDEMPFHRVEPGFVIQAGDPSLAGKGPAGYSIPDEESPLKHRRGTVAMARLYRGGRMLPDSASTQFYICLGDAPHLDQMGFTAFGRVTEGLEVIDTIAVGDRIRRATAAVEPQAGAT